ncbi:hypothetical protein K438DRAFT_1766246 [Mycena galopus ATCC 62051]|nr:hypothetical protein K438DRAFT_1766246 [Mycena galopus ATCC 62051]
MRYASLRQGNQCESGGGEQKRREGHAHDKGEDEKRSGGEGARDGRDGSSVALGARRGRKFESIFVERATEVMMGCGQYERHEGWQRTCEWVGEDTRRPLR